MSTRLAFTVQTVPLCEEIVDYLRSLDIDDDSIGVIASDQTPLPTLPDADLMENDVIPAAQRGGTVGAVTGVVAGLGMTITEPGLAIGGAGLTLAALGGASFGALVSGLMGASAPNSHLQEHLESLEKGELLLIIDIPDDDEQTIRQTLAQRFPSLTLEAELPSSAPIS